TNLASEEMFIAEIGAECPRSRQICFPADAFHIVAPESVAAVTTFLPSLERTAFPVRALGTSKRLISFPVETSHHLAVSSSLPVTTVSLFTMATDSTGPTC